MQVSTSAYYNWLQGSESKRSQENKNLRKKIIEISEVSNGTYGRRRIAASINKDTPKLASINRIERQMKVLGVEGYQPRSFKRTTIPDSELVDSPNLLRDCQVLSIDEAWVSDITYIATKQGWLYLCTIMDLRSRKIIGWKTADNMRADLVVDAFKEAWNSRKPTGRLIFHSDKGGQYKSRKLRRLLKRLGVSQSMTGADHCYDNAVAESFFATLKRELIRGVKFSTRESAEMAIFEYIEVFYNRVRLHSALEYRSPEEFENIA